MPLDMTSFLHPVLALIIWTFLMWGLMYWRRIPAMNAISKDTQAFIENPKLGEQLPPRVRWAADNFNHLHEQPVIFYALMFYLALTGQMTDFNVYLAWSYVFLRVLHSLVQVTSNKVLVRFGLFVISSVVLMIMTAGAFLAAI